MLSILKHCWPRWRVKFIIACIAGIIIYYFPLHCTFEPKGRPRETTGLESELRTSIVRLAGEIGERNVFKKEQLEKARVWIHDQLKECRLEVTEQAVPVVVPDQFKVKSLPKEVYNVIATRPGRNKNSVIVLGAHYDSVPFSCDWEGYDLNDMNVNQPGTSGANDNGSGVAALLAIAKRLSEIKEPLAHTIRLVAFVNEEPPFFQQRGYMGSSAYAQRCCDDEIKVMIALETMAVYTPQARNAKRPEGLGDWALTKLTGLDRTAGYVAFLNHKWGTDAGARARTWAREFSTHAWWLEARTVSIPYILMGEHGLAWSDDWAFVQEGIPAFCVTDTAYRRSDRYHSDADTPQNITDYDYKRFAEVVAAFFDTLVKMAK